MQHPSTAPLNYNCYNKNMVTKQLLTLIICLYTSFTAFNLQAQQVLRGRIIEAGSGQSIPFVHIVIQTAQPFGGVSNIDGDYRIASPSGIPSNTPVRLTCIGYEAYVLPFGEFAQASTLSLKPRSAQIAEVVVTAKEDPGYGIIRKAAEQRKENSPESLPGFRLKTYNKAGLDVERRADVQAELDSTGFANARFFMLESTTEMVYKSPGRWNETVTATQMTGVKNPGISIISNSFQPFSTYTDHLNLMETDFLNPVSPGSHNRYVFQLTDSVEVEGEKVYVVSFQPRAKVVGHLLKGAVSISSSDYAIVNFRASNSSQFNLLDFEIRQNYSKVGGKWFPKESKTRYTVGIADPEMDAEPLPMMLYSTTYLSAIELDYLPTSRDFNVAEVSIAKGAGSIDRDTWASIRPLALDSVESNTYAVFDTLPKNVLNGLNWFMSQSTSLAAGRLKFGKMDVMLKDVLRVNRYEGLRLGLGLSTNSDLINWVSLEGYFAYGFRDQRSKYGAATVFHISRKRAFDLALRYRNDVDEPGRGLLGRDFSFQQQAFAIRGFFTEVMNPIEKYSVEASIRPVRGIKLDLGFSREQRSIAANKVLGEEVFPRFDIVHTQWQAALQWVPGESLIQVGNSLIPKAFNYPRMRLAVAGGLPDVLDGSQDFTKLELDFSHQLRLRRAGELKLFGGAGHVWGNGVAYPYLNFGRGINGFDGIGLEAYGYFQTMQLYDFLMDSYAYGGLVHNFGTIFGIEGKWSKPELKVAYTAGIGDLSNGNTNGAPFDYRQMNKAYLEGGLVIDHLFRYKTRNASTYTSFGFGAFVNHGHYASPNFGDNLAFVFSVKNSL
jgi:hypothetical protein